MPGPNPDRTLCQANQGQTGFTWRRSSGASTRVDPQAGVQGEIIAPRGILRPERSRVPQKCWGTWQGRDGLCLMQLLPHCSASQWEGTVRPLPPRLRLSTYSSIRHTEPLARCGAALRCPREPRGSERWLRSPRPPALLFTLALLCGAPRGGPGHLAAQYGVPPAAQSRCFSSCTLSYYYPFSSSATWSRS